MRIIGHQKERTRLETLAAKPSLRQGYLFTGPESVGKRLVALEFAARLANEPLFEPSPDQASPYDVLILRPEEETKKGVTKQKSIGAEEVREALAFLSRYPASGRFRTVIIEDAHKLSLAAQNVLLKSLEEPETTAVTILVTHEGGGLLDTLLSRVERVQFDFVPEAELKAGIGHLIRTSGPMPALFFFSLGRPGMIIRALSAPESFAVEQGRLAQLFRLSTLSLGERLKLAETLSGNVPESVRLLQWWLPGLRTQALKLPDERAQVRFYGLLEAVEETLTLLKTTQSNARLLFEKLFLSV